MLSKRIGSPIVSEMTANPTAKHVKFLFCATLLIGFNGAETNYGIAHILGILLMNSYNICIVISLATTIICSLSTLN